MLNIEVCILDKVPIAQLLDRKIVSLEGGAEGQIFLARKLIRINLTGVWDLAFEDYDTFLDELVGTTIHEYLHYFFHIYNIPQNEKLIHQLSKYLQVLSIEHLIGATRAKNEDIEGYEAFLQHHFKP